MAGVTISQYVSMNSSHYSDSCDESHFVFVGSQTSLGYNDNLLTRDCHYDADDCCPRMCNSHAPIKCSVQLCLGVYSQRTSDHSLSSICFSNPSERKENTTLCFDLTVGHASVVNANEILETVNDSANGVIFPCDTNVSVKILESTRHSYNCSETVIRLCTLSFSNNYTVFGVTQDKHNFKADLEHFVEIGTMERALRYAQYSANAHESLWIDTCSQLRNSSATSCCKASPIPRSSTSTSSSPVCRCYQWNPAQSETYMRSS